MRTTWSWRSRSGARLLREAAKANGWETSEVQAVLIGMSGPVSEDYVEQIARRAGVPESALKVSVHKACDGSVGSLNLALNPDLGVPGQTNIAAGAVWQEGIAGRYRGPEPLRTARATIRTLCSCLVMARV